LSNLECWDSKSNGLNIEVGTTTEGVGGVSRCVAGEEGSREGKKNERRKRLKG